MSRFGCFYHKEYNQKSAGGAMSETTTSPDLSIVEPERPNNQEMSSEDKVAHIKVLGIVSRFLRAHFREEYARAVEKDIELHTQDVIANGDEHLLPTAQNPPPPGGKEIFPRY
jgi:hypothetical protein